MTEENSAAGVVETPSPPKKRSRIVIRKRETRFRRTRRTIADLIRDILSRPETNARCAAYLSHMYWCFNHDEKPLSWTEFFERESVDVSDINQFANAAKQYPLPDIPHTPTPSCEG